jgi:hypothetical protein
VGAFTDTLLSHAALSSRRAAAERKLNQARDQVVTGGFFADPGLTVFLAGSLGRRDVGERSDFDPFIVSIKTFDDAEQARLTASLDTINAALGYEPFSNRRYIKVYPLSDLLKNTGDPQDDSENSLTARMLLLLESTDLANADTYCTTRDQVLSQYFRDQRGKESFRPLFLLNDVLRYWRTLCLNYEALRHEPDRPWWKKNANLKFSRMVTVFATVIALTTDEIHGKADFEPYCALTPLERLAMALDRLGEEIFLNKFAQFLDDYEGFLSWKESGEQSGREGEQSFKTSVAGSASRFSDFLYDVLSHETIPRDRRKYLVI